MTDERVYLTMDDNEEKTESVDLFEQAFTLLGEQNPLDADISVPVELDDYDKEMITP